jgi:hypothetical protein
MAQQSYRGIVHDGKVVLLNAEPPLAEGTSVIVTATPATTGAALIAALDATSRVPSEWVDELEQIIRAGQQPPSRTDPFAETEASHEGP